MKKSLICLMMMVVALCPLTAGDRDTRVQVALLLDTSNSMDGLINQARERLWRVVNKLSRATKYGKTARFEVALYEYGNSGLSAASGYLRLVVPFTGNLDLVSEKLHALRTNGGSEYCGQVIGQSTSELRWSSSDEDYRAIFIAGNEPFDQGYQDFRQACRAAAGRGISINTIFCGDPFEGIQTHWKEGADLGRGSFLTINQNDVFADIAAPQDARILELGTELNRTYLAFSDRGRDQVRQEAVDKRLAERSQSASVERQMNKATVSYDATDWDVVSAFEEDDEVLESVAEERLPEPMKAMNTEERKQFVAENLSKRKDLIAEMEKLRREREAFIAGQAGNEASLDTAMLKAVADQLAARGFESEP